MEYTLFVDGLCAPTNPNGYACFGWVFKKGSQTLGYGCGFIGKGEGMTNNVAEYNALIMGMTAVIERGFWPFDIRSDSQLVVNQVNGTWVCKKTELMSLRDKAKTLIPNGTLQWIPREQNKEADKMSNIAFSCAKSGELGVRRQKIKWL